MRRWDHESQTGTYIKNVLATFVVVGSAILIGILLAIGFPANGDAQTDQPIEYQTFQALSTHDIESRMLISYFNRVHNDDTDTWTLDTWEYIVRAHVNADGTLQSLECTDRDPNTELPSVRYLQQYLDLGGTLYEDGSCQGVVFVPQSSSADQQ